MNLALLSAVSNQAEEITYDEDAQTYFDELEAASGWSEPADYGSKKIAISNYVVACKAAGNWVKIKVLYIPLWQVAAPNALSAKRSEDGSGVTTYDLTFNGTVTHDNGDFIHGDGSTGYATAPFEGPNGSPTFLGLTDTSYSGNVLGGTVTTIDALFGWYYEGAIVPYHSTTNVNAYLWKYGSYVTAAHNGEVGFWSAESQTPTGANTNKLELWKDGSSMGTGENTTNTIYSSLVNWHLLCAGDSSPPSQASQYETNFVHVGNKMASQSDFLTDTAALLAAL